jgi:hypothetical protein
MDDTRSGTPFLSKKFPVAKEVLCIQSRTSPVVYPTRSSLLPGIWICVLGGARACRVDYRTRFGLEVATIRRSVCR